MFEFGCVCGLVVVVLLMIVGACLGDCFCLGVMMIVCGWV